MFRGKKEATSRIAPWGGYLAAAAWMAAALAALAGCESTDERLVSMATEGARRQSDQSREMVRLQQHVAEGTKQLAAADAHARQEWTALKHDVEKDLAEVGHQRDLLEEERRVLANQRNRDPIIAEAIETFGMMLMCLAPLAAAYFAIKTLQRSEPADIGAAEALLGHFVQRDLPRLSGPDPPELPPASRWLAR